MRRWTAFMKDRRAKPTPVIERRHQPTDGIIWFARTPHPFTQCASKFRFPCEPGQPPRCLGKRETRDRRTNAAAHPVPPEGPAMARAICNLDMGWVYIGVASYLPRRERWRPWPHGWLQHEECGRPEDV